MLYEVITNAVSRRRREYPTGAYHDKGRLKSSISDFEMYFFVHYMPLNMDISTFALITRTFLTVSANFLVRCPCNGHNCPLQGENAAENRIFVSNGQKCPLETLSLFFLAVTA